jgi:hypothetical protein
MERGFVSNKIFVENCAVYEIFPKKCGRDRQAIYDRKYGEKNAIGVAGNFS